MEKNDELLSNLFSNLQAQHPVQSHPDVALDNVMARLNNHSSRRALVLVLRIAGIAASLLLLLGLALHPSHPSEPTVAMAYQQTVLSQKHDAHYVKGKFFDKTPYDIIKQKYDESIH